MGQVPTTDKSSQQATATPQELAMEDIQLKRLQSNQGAQQQLDTSMYGTMNTILNGGQLNGNLQGINGINEDQTQSMVNSSMRDIMPQFQAAGVLNSGVAPQMAMRTTQDTRNQNAQFNVSAMQNLFNQALGGSSSLSSGTTAQNQTLGGQLAGLRSVSGNDKQSTNPFLQSFYGGSGSMLRGKIG